jgi:hypothetical protein
VNKLEIVSIMYEADTNESTYEQRLDKLVWLQSEVKLRYEEDFRRMSVLAKDIIGADMIGVITRRQVGAFGQVMQHVRSGNHKMAYHELCDFIHNTGDDVQRELTSFDVFCLKEMIDAMAHMKKED